MYKSEAFKEENRAKVIAFMKDNPFAVIIGLGNQYPVATHIPVTVEIKEDGKIFLCGHLAKNTDHYVTFEKNENVLVIFNGPHCYVSASWYTNPLVASTWNYMTVHATGKIKFTDEAGTYQAIRNITGDYEGSESVASFDQLPGEYVMEMIKAIVGFNIEVESIENTFKLSQNHPEANRHQIIAHLETRKDAHSQAIAKEMKDRS